MLRLQLLPPEIQCEQIKLIDDYATIAELFYLISHDKIRRCTIAITHNSNPSLKYEVKTIHNFPNLEVWKLPLILSGEESIEQQKAKLLLIASHPKLRVFNIKFENREYFSELLDYFLTWYLNGTYNYGKKDVELKSVKFIFGLSSSFIHLEGEDIACINFDLAAVTILKQYPFEEFGLLLVIPLYHPHKN